MKVIGYQYRPVLYSVFLDEAEAVDVVILQAEIYEELRPTTQESVRGRSKLRRVRYKVKDRVQCCTIDHGTDRREALLDASSPNILHVFLIVNKHKDVLCVDDDPVQEPRRPRRRWERYFN